MSRAIIFDLDGTLADTSGDLLNAANAVFEMLGYAAPLGPDDRITAVSGGRAMLKLGVERLEIDDPNLHEMYYWPLIEKYRNALCVKTQLYDGTVEMLQELTCAGYDLGVCTNKPIQLAVPLLKLLGISHYFKSVIGVRSFPVMKPDPTPFWAAVDGACLTRENAVIIGDTATDANTALRANAQCVLVDFDGTGIGEKFPQFPCINHFSELFKILN